MKKIIVPLLVLLLVIVIYNLNNKKNIDYVVLGDSISLGINSYGNKTFSYSDYLKIYLDNNNLLHEYYPHYVKSKYKIDELNQDIINNKIILFNDRTYNIKKELREADLITIAIGMDNLVEILKNNQNKDFKDIQIFLDNLINQMDKLLKNITSINKTQIVLLGYYNPSKIYNKTIERIFAYLNDNYSILSKKYKVTYVDIYNIVKNNALCLSNQNDYHLTSKGYLKIAEEIIKKVNL